MVSVMGALASLGPDAWRRKGRTAWKMRDVLAASVGAAIVGTCR
jgi:hypothetical protein